MRSSNPVFSRRGFSRDGSAGFQAGQPQAGNPYAAQAGNPYAQAQPGVGHAPAAPRTDRMTMDDVVSRTAMTLGTVVLTATAAWILNVGLGIAIVALLFAFGLGMWQSFKAKASPPLIIAYAVFEGVFLGAMSNYINTYAPGAAMQAVIGTMAVFGAVLFLYKSRIIRVNARFARFAIAAGIGYGVLCLVNLGFALFGAGDGWGFRTGTVGILMGIAGVVIASLFLALDFKQVEDGIAYGAPREEAWLAAFGLTMTLAWIYFEFLRLAWILNSSD
ncbi:MULTISPECIES: Bax inhibitor-1/YccA family protein [unclassified Streptomyces]|uniref:Bax inhibitor-1/YccA family protein n=1 Tax=unclassified Streptomyces TaxID=2593676 RepID=UPI0022B71869|nr:MULTISPECIES: Bax inhibitor-1/YccA family protein [unclassified Streptomyces]MCZ7414645.1 Bax inhibitor-1/YccA family protein [Streptomyces sp. WMMC897]MCZ7431574.1 Bax inhibitor-1/YccA family protein [Streptomyces sp. WMMC1477]